METTVDCILACALLYKKIWAEKVAVVTPIKMYCFIASTVWQVAGIAQLVL